MTYYKAHAELQATLIVAPMLSRQLSRSQLFFLTSTTATLLVQ